MSHQHVSEIGVDAIPSPCRSCVFWEAGGSPGPELPSSEQPSARLAKESWWQATSLEWGPCALGAWDGGRLRGYAFVAPAPYLEGVARFGRVTDDALLLAVLWIDDWQDAPAVARPLVEGSLRLVAARGAKALEAFTAAAGDVACAPDESILRACGFALLRDGLSYRHYRLDLRQTVRWKEGVEEALAGVRRVLRGRRLGRVPSMPSTVVATYPGYPSERVEGVAGASRDAPGPV